MLSGKKDCILAIILVGIAKSSHLSLCVKLAKANKKNRFLIGGKNGDNSEKRLSGMPL
jgi:hypothetical protein